MVTMEKKIQTTRMRYVRFRVFFGFWALASGLAVSRSRGLEPTGRAFEFELPANSIIQRSVEYTY